MAVPEDDEKPYLTVEEEIALSKPENGDMYVPSALFYLAYKEQWSWLNMSWKCFRSAVATHCPWVSFTCFLA
jgi:hypothetical protein